MVLSPSLPAGYSFQSGKLPSVPEYRHLRAASGLTPVTEAQAVEVPKGTWFACHITSDAENGKAVAMGRVLGDGGWYFFIADMAVLPEHQRKGLGDAVLKHLLAYIKENAPEGEPCVCLFADPPGRKLYQRNGFVESAPQELGMILPSGWRDRL
ncbi:putative GNAT family N-acetyltransferase [Podospora aff. communis PSN243]|uniref:GNAT family N-acetyltransferase n=1 Tax=Podospora aff. communis PSN243 TaxID=3040156 RepID=A0AAV9GQT4_9PEZI|nr:putative GNAT family N-acetyltransferase [Podospora aff. communis PSN243]